MSKHNNVHPNFYKDAGREHTEGADKGDAHEEPKALPHENEHGKKMQGREGQPNFIPGEAVVGQPGRTRAAKKKE